MKLTILWSRLASYTVAFFRQLANSGCTIQLSHIAPGGHLRFDPFDTSFCYESQEVTEPVGIDWAKAVLQFSPDVVLMSGWKFPDYMRIARECRQRGAPIVSAMDNPWRGDLRQRAACVVAPWLLHRTIDALYVCGERQLQFARKLGFRNAFTGLYAAEIDRFEHLPPLVKRPNRFLFVGRLVERKGIRVLLEAYSRYRESVAQPMGLLIGGRGPLEGLCRQTAGVDLTGFVNPEDLPGRFAEGQCLVLPSWLEHWGVVLHEAAAAGLPLIASEACGASTVYLRDGSNGLLIRPDINALLAALLEFHGSSADQRQRMSEQSRRLACTWSPDLQADHFLRKLKSLRS